MLHYMNFILWIYYVKDVYAHNLINKPINLTMKKNMAQKEKTTARKEAMLDIWKQKTCPKDRQILSMLLAINRKGWVPLNETNHHDPWWKLVNSPLKAQTTDLNLSRKESMSILSSYNSQLVECLSPLEAVVVTYLSRRNHCFSHTHRVQQLATIPTSSRDLQVKTDLFKI